MQIHNSKKQQDELIEQVMNLLGHHDNVLCLFKKFDIDPARMADIKIYFDEMDVSAKARKNSITLNKKFLKDGNIVDDLHYIVHELVHVLQHMAGWVEKLGDRQYPHYLDNPLELQAFKEQIDFIKEYKNQEEADKYLKKLLDFHNFDGEERAEKERVLRDTK